MPAKSIRITGLVQGVCFRRETQVQAEALGLTGWVRNRDDDSVEVHAEGEKKALDALIAWCYKGPEAAQVATVTVDTVEEEGADTFVIAGIAL